MRYIQAEKTGLITGGIKQIILALLCVVLILFATACSSEADSRTTNTSPNSSTPSPAPSPKTQNESSGSDSSQSLITPEPSKPSKPSGAIDWSDAQSYVGQNATIYGSVKGTKYASSSNGRPTFINIGVDYPDSSRFQIVIWGEDRGNFSTAPDKLYSGKTLCVTGYVDSYNGIPQIEVSSPSQITVVD